MFCLQSHPSDPWLHLLRDEEGETKFNFKLSESLRIASETPLLAGWIFHTTPSVMPPPSEMQGIYNHSFIMDGRALCDDSSDFHCSTYSNYRDRNRRSVRRLLRRGDRRQIGGQQSRHQLSRRQKDVASVGKACSYLDRQRGCPYWRPPAVIRAGQIQADRLSEAS